MGAHLVGVPPKFKSDKYDWCPEGFVPLKVSDPDAQEPLLIYAERHRARDPEFSDDLAEAVRQEGYAPAQVGVLIESEDEEWFCSFCGEVKQVAATTRPTRARICAGCARSVLEVLDEFLGDGWPRAVAGIDRAAGKGATVVALVKVEGATARVVCSRAVAEGESFLAAAGRLYEEEQCSPSST